MTSRPLPSTSTGRVEQALLLTVKFELELVEHLARARLGEQLLDELELMLAVQVLLLAVELELDLEHTEQVLQAVELGVDLLDVLDLLDTLGRERARL